jgi:hypothetical protein
MVDVTMEEFEGLSAVNPTIFPVPLAASPIDVKELVQV